MNPPADRQPDLPDSGSADSARRPPLGCGERLAPLRLAACLQAEQRACWLRGQRVPVEVYLENHPALAADAEAALDLIYAEFTLRQELGEAPLEEEYLRRFPQFRVALQRQFRLDQALLSASTEEASAAETATVEPGGPPVPLVIGKYPVVALLEEGGQATVYRGVHPLLQRDVVIKLSRAVPLNQPRDRDRLQREGRILAELEHPNLARVYDLDVDQGRVFLVLEYIRGQNLGQGALTGRRSPRQSGHLIAQVAGAVALAHRNGILHLDINPNNILLDEDGRPRLVDFGLASWRRGFADCCGEAGKITGTPAFMAPEQARGEAERIGVASDVFGLGGTLYYLLTQRPPFTGADGAEVLQNARKGAFDRSALARARVPPALARICLRAMAPTPAERYRSVEELSADLEACARPPRWRVPVVGLVGLLLLAGALAVAWSGWWRHSSTGGDPALPPSSLVIRVHTRGDAPDEFRRLAAPLRVKYQVQITVDAPPPLYLSLFLFSSAGELRLLAERAPTEELQPQRYPLKRPLGTDFVLVCGRRSGPISLEEVQRLWEPGERWPALHEMTILGLRRDGVVVLSESRNFGPAEPVPSPEEIVTRRLDVLRERLQGYEYFEGVAFAVTD